MIPPSVGFVYVTRKKVRPMQNASVGATINIEGRGPPWIVVDHDPSSVILTDWPGRLWRVRIVEAATELDQESVGGPPLPSARYTRCVSVYVEAEEDLAILFGKHGSGVVRVLDEASLLSRDAAEMLCCHRHPDAPAAQDRVWRSWLRIQGVTDDYDESLDGTLEIGGKNGGSPINRGLMALSNTVLKRAEDVDGGAATESDEEDTWLVHPWNGACDALCDAALALGAPNIVEVKDREILLSGWSKAFG